VKLILTRKTLETLRRELKRARRREIGGVLVGQHLGKETFRIAGISVQHDGGSAAHFERDPVQAKEFLEVFFTETGRDFSRFNYLGEWHSHPTFTVLPSPTDRATMYSIVDDPKVDTAFAVLVICRMHPWWGLQLSAEGFRSGVMPDPIDLEGEAGDRVARQFVQLRAPPVRKIRWI
jgi:integrative and conjugative element protein (TIGR02256 family)